MMAIFVAVMDNNVVPMLEDVTKCVKKLVVCLFFVSEKFYFCTERKRCMA